MPELSTGRFVNEKDMLGGEKPSEGKMCVPQAAWVFQGDRAGRQTYKQAETDGECRFEETGKQTGIEEVKSRACTIEDEAGEKQQRSQRHMRERSKGKNVSQTQTPPSFIPSAQVHEQT